jgi:hypothetical protein
MNAADADGTAHGTGVRGEPPGKMMVNFVGVSAKRFEERSKGAFDAPDGGLPPFVSDLLAERKIQFQATLASPLVTFLNPSRTKAKLQIGKGSAIRERSVSIATSNPTCECGSFKVDSIHAVA